jgi:hypothetical protein
MQDDGDRREMGGTAGPDCVIAILPDGQTIGAAERRALRALAEAGLIPEAGLNPVISLTRAVRPSGSTYAESKARPE